MWMDGKTKPLYDTPQARWEAVAARDAAADGVFFFGVTSTGVYCRPGCASRTPRRENVRFFDDSQAAQAAGFRACRRCRPDQPGGLDQHTRNVVARACALMDAAESCPSLGELADAVGLSPYHFQRLFRRTLGITPRQYYAQKRVGRVRAALSDGGAVSAAVYEAGYGSSAGFYDQAQAVLGMSPAVYAQGGPGAHIRYTVRPCWLGHVLIAATDAGICEIALGDDPALLEENLRRRFPAARLNSQDARFEAWAAATLAFLEQPARGLDLPLDIQGTAFQRRVWQALREIPCGQRESYADLARRIGKPSAARAVAHACASNHIAVAIPCHRIVRGNGDLGGYRWGLERKRRLLDLEEAG